jgi:hypothetical protein
MSKQNKAIWAVLAGIAALALLVLPPLLADDVGAFWEGMLGLVMLLVMALLYILPSLIAWKRKHKSTGGIVALNILAGWTFIGWLIALVWSLSSAREAVVVQQFTAPVAVTQYQVGDVVNGHRFNGQTWEPIA